MEHDLAEKAEEDLCRVLDHPDLCPDDNQLIPECDKNVKDCIECGEESLSAKEVVAAKAREKLLMPLISLKGGQTGKIAFIRGGRGAVQRLSDMGLTPKTRIKVLKEAPFRGPVEVFVRGSRLVIGRGIAMKIFVEAT